MNFNKLRDEAEALARAEAAREAAKPRGGSDAFKPKTSAKEAAAPVAKKAAPAEKPVRSEISRIGKFAKKI